MTTHARDRRRRTLLALATFAAALVVLPATAPAQYAAEDIQAKLSELESVQAEKDQLAGSIEAQNAQINAMIGDVSRLMREESAVQAELDDMQARLDRANAELDAGKERLRQLRARLARAIEALEELVVDIYKSGDPDLLAVVLGSESWDALVAESAYLDAIQDHEGETVDRVQGLRTEAAGIVEDLAEIQDRVKVARDDIRIRRDKVAIARQRLDQRRAELKAALAARQARLGDLSAREQALAEELAPKGLGPGAQATLLPNGQAVPPPDAPLVVRAVIESANAIAHKPYIWGGGHGSFEDDGYDCSGAISYALHGGGLLDSPLDSTGFTYWGNAGAGNWITVYAHGGHAYAVIAGLRWDTSGGAGPRWHADMRSPSGFIARHPAGF